MSTIAPEPGAVTAPDSGPHTGLRVSEMPLEELVYQRVQAFLDCEQDVGYVGVYALVMRHVERALLRAALEQTGGHRVNAAKVLGINRNTLARKLKELGLDG